MSESTQRSVVCKKLKHLDAIPVENRVGPGTPDVNYVEGWIELKWMRRWPKNAHESPVLVEHYSPQQRVWHKKRWIKKGNVWLLFQVAQEWFLFDGLTASERFGRATRPELFEMATAHWAKGLNAKELTECLTRSTA